jgi:hemolysin III
MPHASQVPAATRPRLRGVIHHYSFYGSLVMGGLLIALAPGRTQTLVAMIYGASLSALLGVSALYHRVTWSLAARRHMGRLDHSMINILIAGTFTPFGVLVLSGTFAVVLLTLMWGGALLNILLHVFWIDAPKWLSAMSYVALGWVGVVAMPELTARGAWVPMVLLLVGGLLYSAGALVYALRRPDPVPGVFGYHEVFHGLVVVAAAVHYAAVVLTVLPAT